MAGGNLLFTPKTRIFVLELLLSLAVLFSLACGIKNGASLTVRAEASDQRTANARMQPTKPNTNETTAADFYASLDATLAKRGLKTSALYNSADEVERRILEDYGAVFLASEKVLPPPVCIFTSAEEVSAFQTKAKSASIEIAGARIELQHAALSALLKARAEAVEKNLNITPRDGAEASRRSFEDTVRLWNSRFLPALDYWETRGRLSAEQAEELKSLPVRRQVAAVLELEKAGIFFNTFFNNSILYSVAAPGASQHLSMLAFDAVQFGNPRIRQILARHGWFRTVKGDAPHFTFLGVAESDLPSLGLKKIETGDGEFWIPNVTFGNQP